jgi:hypothetical protein
MSLGNQDIDGYVHVIVGALLRDAKVLPKDEPTIKAATEIVVNLLQNINDIAFCAIDAYDRANR